MSLLFGKGGGSGGREDGGSSSGRSAWLRSFVGQRTRKLSKLKDETREVLLPSVQVRSWEDVVSGFDSVVDGFDSVPVSFEIGCGSGEMALHLAQRNPGSILVVCDVFMDGLLNLCREIGRLGVSNIGIFSGDGRGLFAQVPDGRLSDVYLLFPDPWPKRRHHKRRIVNQEFLSTAFLKLHDGGSLWMATDLESYQIQMGSEATRSSGFCSWDVSVGGLGRSPECNPPDWWCETKYYLKAVREGRKSMFFRLRKVVT